jgi:hypothetical protein
MTQRTYYWIGRASPVVFDDMTPRKPPRPRATVRAASQGEAVTKMQARLDTWLAEASPDPFDAWLAEASERTRER